MATIFGYDVQYSEITDRSVLQPGDTISVTGQASSGIPLFYHLGIYIGNDEVIDYTNESEIRRIHVNTFTENGTRPLFRAQYSAAPSAYLPGVIVERAVQAWRTPSEFGKYGVMSNNCEHFVTYCTFGERVSFQVKKVAKTILTATIGTIGGIAGAALQRGCHIS